MESSPSSSTSTSNGPRPLATKPEYVRRSHTSRSGLLSSTTSNTASSNINNTRNELDHFFFKRPVSDSLLQPNAKRARKEYRSILRDQYYLLDVKKMWQTKLKKLQMEQMLLEQMCAYTQEDVNDIPPLFSQNDPNALQDPQPSSLQHPLGIPPPSRHDDIYSLRTPAAESFPSSPQSSLYMTAEDLISETNSVTNPSCKHVLRTSPTAAKAEPKITTSDTVHENNGACRYQDDLHGLVDSENDSNGDDEDEDEETARRALTFMLAHYGNDL